MEHTDETIDLREVVQGLLTGRNKMSQSAIAREAGLSTAALSRWLQGTYEGSDTTVEAKLQRWLDSRTIADEYARTMPPAPDWVETPTAKRVHSAMAYAQMAGDIALVYGGAGLGKTTAARKYQQQSPNVWLVTMTPASAGVVTALETIAEEMGITIQGGASKLHKAIVRKVTDTRGLIVIDEAQHLSVAALDQIRSIHDATQIGLVLQGNEQVYSRLASGTRAAFLDRLFSRIGYKVKLGRSTQGDVAAVLDAWEAPAACAKPIMEIASRPGALRSATKVLRLATSYAIGEGRQLAAADVAAAARELGGVQ